METDLAFGLATELIGKDWLVSAASGVLGLGLDGLSTMPDSEVRKGATLFSRLVKQRQLADPVLSIRLDKGHSERGVMHQEGGGQLTFGGIESQYVVGGRAGLAWAPVSSSQWWYVFAKVSSVSGSLTPQGIRVGQHLHRQLSGHGP